AHLVKVRVRRAKKFTSNFCRAVGTDCLGQMLILGKWDGLRSSVHRRTRSEDKSLNSRQACCLEKMQCSEDVRVVIKPRRLNGGPDASPGSQVHNGVYFFAAKHSSDRIALSKIDVTNGYVFCETGNVCVLNLR